MATATPILATHDLGLDIGGAHIVADVSLEVRAGELVGIIGPNGAGKTTLFNLLSGRRCARRPDASSSTAGTSRTEPPYRAHAAPGSDARSRSRASSRSSPVRRERPSRRRGSSSAARSGSGGARPATEPALERADWALERGRARATRAPWPAGSARPTATSASSSSRCCSRATPRVILLDEPMAGVSVEDVDGLVELIRSVHAEEGKTVLIVEHRMEVVIGLAERIAVMHHGALLAFDAPDGRDGERDRPDGLSRGAAVSTRRPPSRVVATSTSTSASRTCCRGSRSTSPRTA